MRELPAVQGSGLNSQSCVPMTHYKAGTWAGKQIFQQDSSKNEMQAVGGQLPVHGVTIHEKLKHKNLH